MRFGWVDLWGCWVGVWGEDWGCAGEGGVVGSDGRALVFPVEGSEDGCVEGVGGDGVRGVAVEEFECLEDLFDGRICLVPLVGDWGVGACGV